jgi:hypothetical protein
MRPSGFDRAAACASIALAWLACSPAPLRPSPPPPVAAPAPTLAAAPAAAASPSRRTGRALLAEPHEAALPFVLQAIPGREVPRDGRTEPYAGQAVLAVAADADDQVTWARRLAAGAQGPLLRFLGHHVIGAYDRSDGTTTWVTSDGASVCISPSAEAASRKCVELSPSALVAVGDRLAALEVTSTHPAPRASSKAREKPKEAKGAIRKGKHATKRAHPKPAHAAPPRPSHPLVEVFVRWIEPNGDAAAEPTPTGLRFEAPLDGMTLADARARPPGIDLLWFETAPKRKTRAPLGSGRLMAGSLRADGTLDLGSRVAVVDADVEFGQLADHRAPRLVGSAASKYVALDAKGQCEALVVRPRLSRIVANPTTCAIAPDRIGNERADESAAFGRILAYAPRRAFGQPRNDPGLVAWAGDRGYWLRGAGLRSASILDAAPRDEPHPFPARRAKLAWGALATEGDGVAFVDGGLVRTDADGHVTRGLGSAPAVTVAELPSERRRAVRIGATWWLSRGAHVRLTPEVAAKPAAEGHPDAQVLVGGPTLGLAIEVASGALRSATVDAAGASTAAAAVSPSPVLPGFDACERASGGAIVAGVSSTKPGDVVALVVDAAGRPGTARSVQLPFLAGDLAVRLVPLPAGGALLTDLERHHVVWLDDDARPLGAATWPADASDAACPYGRPMRRSVPAPKPEQFIAVPDVAEGACIVGDAVWARDGSLRWFGGTTDGLDFYPELASLPLLPPAPVPVPVSTPAPAPVPVPVSAPAPARVCPPEMVSIGGRFCVDRFEAMIVDARTGEPLSPDYPTTPNLRELVLGEWATARERMGSVHARAFPLPQIPIERLHDKPVPLAVARLGVRPSGYLTGLVAAAACGAAGKRLCSLDEFVTACRGEADTLFPYGDSYEDGVCNVFREEHPAALLHDNASIGHLDPRLNRVRSHGRPLLQHTGGSPACRSRWGDDAVYDMVGNLDEWVDEGAGAFAGGFYARSTRSGCEAVVTAHPKSYLDYSTGLRCCRDHL